MKLLYTGAPDFNQQQPDPLQSLGGYISSTELNNGGLNNLFDSISQRILYSKNKQNRAVALHNDSSSQKTINIYYENISNQPLTSIKMGLQSPATDDCQGKYVQKIPGPNNSPSQIIFSDNRSEANALTVTLQPDEYVGLWIERSINSLAAQQYLDCENMINKFESDPSNAVFKIQLNGNSVQYKHFFLSTADSDTYVWFNDIDNVQDPILIAGKESIKVDVSSTDTIEQIVDKTILKLQQTLQQRQEVKVTKHSSNTITIEMMQEGYVTPPSSDQLDLTIEQTQGSSNENEVIEKVNLIIQD